MKGKSYIGQRETNNSVKLFGFSVPLPLQKQKREREREREICYAIVETWFFSQRTKMCLCVDVLTSPDERREQRERNKITTTTINRNNRSTTKAKKRHIHRGINVQESLLAVIGNFPKGCRLVFKTKISFEYFSLSLSL